MPDREHEVSLDQAITREVQRQLMDGNGRSTPDTMGLTMREILLEVRADVKDIKETDLKQIREDFADHKLRPHVGAIGRTEMYGAIVTLLSLAFGAARLFL